MKNKYNKLTCLFGHHDYSKRTTTDKDGHEVYLCKICKRSGYINMKRSGYINRADVYHDYDNDGNCIHKRWDDEFEAWYNYDKRGNCIHKRWSDGYEVCKTNDGRWVPKNQGIGNMKFDEKYPNIEILPFQAGDVMKGSDEKLCWHCNTPTAWIEINFQAPLCSEECVKAKWNEYARACKGEKP